MHRADTAVRHDAVLTAGGDETRFGVGVIAEVHDSSADDSRERNAVGIVHPIEHPLVIDDRAASSRYAQSHIGLLRQPPATLEVSRGVRETCVHLVFRLIV